MLQQAICLTCEKVITGVAGDISLINVFNKMIAGIPVGIDISQDAVAPKEWAVYAAYDVETGDDLKEYVFCMQVFYPDNRPFGGLVKQKMEISPPKRCSLTANLNAFPIGQVGIYRVRAWVEENYETVIGPTELKVELELNRTLPPPGTVTGG